jgi:RHS repeat-associated protein
MRAPAPDRCPVLIVVLPVALYRNDAPLAEAWGSCAVWSGAEDDEGRGNSVAAQPTSTVTRHGYTGHEMVDAFVLINMNGRWYDPSLGRMMQVDPFVSEPLDLQNYNRYSYVDNNPFSATDPSGYKKFWKGKGWIKIRGVIIVVVGVVIMYYSGGNPAVFSVGLYTFGNGLCDLGWTCKIKEKSAENGVSVSADTDAHGQSSSGSSGQTSPNRSTDGTSAGSQGDQSGSQYDGLIVGGFQGAMYFVLPIRQSNEQIGDLLSGALDGHLTDSEAIAWYHYGGGNDLFVDATKLEVLNSGYRAIVLGANDYAVHGEVKLSARGWIYSGLYDYDQHQVRSLGDAGRNVATWLRSTFGIGRGTSYMIHYVGAPRAYSASVW